MINTALLSNWENWLRIFLMVAVGVAIVHFVSKRNSNKSR